MEDWNPWHGCHKISPGCRNCYVYRRDSAFGKDSSVVAKTANFDLPIRRKRNGEYALPSGSDVFSCGTSDFFLDEADGWRKEAWSFIKARPDVDFLIITKRIDRFEVNLPDDWGNGYDNVQIGCTAENQDRANWRLPIFLEAKIRHRLIIAEPLLEELDLRPFLSPLKIERVVAGGESGDEGRVCRFTWMEALHRQCVESRVPFTFKQTGTHLEKGGKVYTIERKQQHVQAKRAGIDFL